MSFLHRRLAAVVAAAAIVLVAGGCATVETAGNARPSTSTMDSPGAAAELDPCGLVTREIAADLKLGSAVPEEVPLIMGSRYCSWRATVAPYDYYALRAFPLGYGLDNAAAGYVAVERTQLDGYESIEALYSESGRGKHCFLFTDLRDKGGMLLAQFERGYSENGVGAGTSRAPCTEARRLMEAVVRESVGGR